MPLLALSADAALDHRRDPRNVWPTHERRAGDLYPIALPRFQPSFSITREDRIFCLGSCFAREIEAVLSREGFAVLSKPARPQPEDSAGGTNLYSVAAIAQVIDDAFAGEAAATAPREVAGQTRADTLFGGVREASVVLVTLGLSEVWFDRETGRYLNLMPPVKALRRDTGRYELRVLDFAETERILRSALQRLAAGARSPRVLLTVSPIPLHSSFRADDVFLSNAYSKSVLRAAVDAVRFDMPGVEYFPSYEMATLSDPRAVWGDADFRHVDRQFVTVITSHALAGLVRDESQDFTARRDAARAILEQKLGRTGSRKSIPQRLEASVMRRVLSPKKFRKYQRGRDAFFEDASNPLVRAYRHLVR